MSVHYHGQAAGLGFLPSANGIDFRSQRKNSPHRRLMVGKAGTGPRNPPVSVHSSEAAPEQVIKCVLGTPFTYQKPSPYGQSGPIRRERPHRGLNRGSLI